MKLAILSYNIRFGGTGREELLAEVIEKQNPDIVVFQEAIVPAVIERIGSRAGFPFWAAKKNHSIGYCSRIPIEHHEWHYLPGIHHAFLEIVIAPAKVRIFGLHLKAMFSKWGEVRRSREIRHLIESIKQHREGFHVLIGDFNSLAPGEILETKHLPYWIRGMVWLSGRELQRETVKFMQENGYTDGFRNLHPDDKGYTFPTHNPHVRLDYIFLPSLSTDRLSHCEVIRETPADKASDHFPLLSRLEIP